MSTIGFGTVFMDCIAWAWSRSKSIMHYIVTIYNWAEWRDSGLSTIFIWNTDIKKNTISLSPPQARKNWVLDVFLTIGDGSKMVIKKIFFKNICHPNDPFWTKSIGNQWFLCPQSSRMKENLENSWSCGCSNFTTTWLY